MYAKDAELMLHKAWKMLYTILIHSFIYAYQKIHSFAALTRFVFYNLSQLVNKNHTCKFFMKLSSLLTLSFRKEYSSLRIHLIVNVV